MYGILPYYLAVFLVNLPLEMIPQIVYGSIVYNMANLRGGFEHFATYIGILILENFVGIGLGMILSASLRSVEMAPQLAPACVIIFLMFSGYFLNEDSIPVYLEWLKYISFIRYAFQALCVNEFDGAYFTPRTPTTSACPTGTDFSSGTVYLDKWLNFSDVKISMNCVYLGLELFAFNLVAFAILYLRKPQFLSISGGEPVQVQGHVATEIDQPESKSTV